MPDKKQFNSNEEYLQWYRDYRAKNAKKLREYTRKYNKKWRKENGYHNEYNSKKRYPEKERARQLLQYAVKIGSITRLPCEVCGQLAQGHHEDYLKPLEVTWLCPLHHAEKHKTKC